MSDTPAPDSHVATAANGAPERIWAYSHTGSEWRDGQFRPYDCSSMFGEVQEYVRADLLQHLQKQRSRARTRFNPDGTYDFIDDDPLPQTNLPGDAPVLFGLEAQGHIPAVEAALSEGADWQEIGRRIGWDGETARTYYERHLARQVPPPENHMKPSDGILELLDEAADKAFAASISDMTPTNLRRLRAVIDAALPPENHVDGWQDIGSAARDGSEVLTWNGRRRHVAHFDKIEGEWVSSFKTTTRRLVVAPSPTHWSPLPTEPFTTEGQPDA